MQQKKEEKKSRKSTKVARVNTGFRMDKALFELVERNYPQGRTEGIVKAIESDLKVMRSSFMGFDLLSGWSAPDKNFILIISGFDSKLGNVLEIIDNNFSSRPEAIRYGEEYLKGKLYPTNKNW